MFPQSFPSFFDNLKIAPGVAIQGHLPGAAILRTSVDTSAFLAAQAICRAKSQRDGTLIDANHQ